MEAIRVLLAGISTGVLREILERITELRPDMEVVGHASRGDLPEAIGGSQADAVILGLSVDEFPKICSDLLDEFPDTVVVGIAADGKRTLIHVDNIGPDELLNAIQAARSQTKRRRL